MQIIEQCLGGQIQVRALVRSPAKLESLGGQIKILQGDVLDIDAVERALDGADAAVSTLGARGLGETTLYSDSIENIIASMQKLGKKRLLCVSAVGVDPVPNISLIAKMVTAAFLKKVFADMARMQRLIEACELDWTIMWPPMLTNGGLTGSYRTAVDAAVLRGRKISRADLAHCMIKTIEDEESFGKKMAVAY